MAANLLKQSGPGFSPTTTNTRGTLPRAWRGRSPGKKRVPIGQSRKAEPSGHGRPWHRHHRWPMSQPRRSPPGVASIHHPGRALIGWGQVKTACLRRLSAWHGQHLQPWQIGAIQNAPVTTFDTTRRICPPAGIRKPTDFNGTPARTRTWNQPRKPSGLLYRNRLCNNASASRGFFLRFISRSKARASSKPAGSTAATISRLPPNRFVECVWPQR